MNRSWSRRPLAVLTAVAALAIAAPTASAAEAHVENIDGVTVIVFTAAPGEKNSVLVDRDPGFTGDQYQLEDQDNNVTPGFGCANAPRFPSGSNPKIVRCGSAATTIRVALGDGDDSVRFGKLNGNVITDVVDGAGGNDRLDTSEGESLVTGGDGEDTIDTNAGNDEVLAGAGNDDVLGGPGSDTLHGDDGNDTILAHAKPDTGEIGIVPEFRAGDVNIVRGGVGADTLLGDNGADEIHGDSGSDKLSGAGGPDTLDGGDGNDTIDEGDTPGDPNGNAPAGVASDTIRGGGGKDTATYCTRFYSESEARKHPLTITLDNKANDGEKGEKDNFGPRGDVENVIGGGVTPDKITGNSKANVLSGDCVIAVGRSGANKIFGGSGNDKVVGGDGNDLLNGGKGADGFIGNAGNDTVQAKDGARDKSINCDGFSGKGSKDKAFVDRSDPSAANCDSVRR